jgi:hypothetical protein
MLSNMFFFAIDFNISRDLRSFKAQGFPDERRVFPNAICDAIIL